MYVLAFDRDWTVDVNPHPHHEAVPLEWVRYWAHDTPHEVWAIGNQDLVDEANIPGTVESIRRRDGDLEALGETGPDGYYEWWPDRDERLRILADLFPDAAGYVVVDDLDLSHVDGWDHYHAWDFADAVRQGDLPLTTPSTDTAPDGGFDDPDEVREILANGHVFELTYRDDDEQATYLVTHVEPDRPSMTPLKGPPTFWFDPVGDNSQFSVRFPDIDRVQAVPYERLPGPTADVALLEVSTQIHSEDETVAQDTVETMLADVVADPTSVGTDAARRLITAVVEHRHEARPIAVEAAVSHLAARGDESDPQVVEAIRSVAEDDPSVVEPHVSELAAIISDSDQSRHLPTRCVMDLAGIDPSIVLDVVPALESAAATGDDVTRGYAVYALSEIADAYPEEVFPAIDVLVSRLQTDDETTQTNALAALGTVASNYPDAAKPIIDQIAPLLDASEDQVRNNAVGLLADLAQQHPAVVIQYAAEIAALLEDANPQARVNASIALLRAGEADPQSIRAVQPRLERALTDSHPDVRANVCRLVGNARVPLADRLADLQNTDDDDTVREAAAWALARLD
jgi:hypothetical protein